MVDIRPIPNTIRTHFYLDNILLIRNKGISVDENSGEANKTIKAFLHGQEMALSLCITFGATCIRFIYDGNQGNDI